MKRICLIILIFMFSSNVFYGQSLQELNRKIDSLNLIVGDIDLQINELNKIKDNVRLQISEVNQKKNKIELEKESLEGIPVIINSMGGTLRDKPSIEGNNIANLPAGVTVLIFNWYEKPFFKAAYKEKVGYISHSSLENNAKIKAIINKDLANDDTKLSRLINKYGSNNAQRIIKGEYWIGMTSDMAKESIGFPDDINKDSGTWGVHEQWIYSKKDLYLYFENEILTSFQN